MHSFLTSYHYCVWRSAGHEGGRLNADLGIAEELALGWAIIQDLRSLWWKPKIMGYSWDTFTICHNQQRLNTLEQNEHRANQSSFHY